ncbi:MAG: flagellar motor switch protein FliM [Pirellulaceae bacterium]|jgi:flagellar motor switch protein FliM
MSDEVLSQEEIESLLAAIDSSQPAKSPEQMQRAAAPRTLGRNKMKVKPYDFKRPERVGKEQMRALQSLHEGFGRNYGATLASLLRCIVDVKLTSIDQLTYSEFIFSLENPTCFNVIKATPMEGNWILDINPAVIFPIISRLLGGGTSTTEAATRRPLTEIEIRLVARITDLFLDELRTAWTNVIKLELSVDRVESNPQLVQIVPPNEVVIVVSFEMTFGKVRGMMNLCIPFNSIERFAPKLASNNWTSYMSSIPDEETTRKLRQQIIGAKVELVVQLAKSSIPMNSLLTLRVGDVITTDHDINLPLDVMVEDVPKFKARPGTLKGKYAIEIAGRISKAGS